MFRALVICGALVVFASLATGEDKEIGVYAGHSNAAIKHVNMGADLSDRGETKSALREFDEAIRIDPTMWPVYFNRARLYFKLHQWQLALKDVNQSIRMKPKFFENYILRARVLANLGAYKPSLIDANKAVDIIPGPYYQHLARVHNHRAWFLATCPDGSVRDGKLAIVDATKACKRTNWKNADYVDTLAAACAEVGDFSNAVRYEEQALSMGDLSEEDKSAGPKARDRLQLYKKHMPFRSTRF
jgi:tetratricopeptide (TPR) repeat protein